ncbi:MAG: hypothetical protein R2748_13010 [Bryobacterales bacterium]
MHEGDWLWRLAWHDRSGYGASYLRRGGPDGPMGCTLYKTEDGVGYEKVVDWDIVGCTETTIRFELDGTMIATVRSGRPQRWATSGGRVRHTRLDLEVSRAALRRSRLRDPAQRPDVDGQPPLRRQADDRGGSHDARLLRTGADCRPAATPATPAWFTTTTCCR